MKSNREIRAEAKAAREQVALDKVAEEQAILDKAALDLIEQVQQPIVQIIPVAIEYQIPIPDVLILNDEVGDDEEEEEEEEEDDFDEDEPFVNYIARTKSKTNLDEIEEITLRLESSTLEEDEKLEDDEDDEEDEKLEDDEDDEDDDEEEVEEVVEAAAVVKQKQKRIRCVYKPITDRDSRFDSLALVDQYIRTTNQFNFKIINNNPVKCSFKCGEIDDHTMQVIYSKCLCKKPECNKQYRYNCCPMLNYWTLVVSGQHPFVVNNEPIAQLEIPLLIKDLIDEILSTNPDMKPKQLHIHLETTRRLVELQVIDIKVRKQRFANFVPKVIPNPKFIFPASLLPSLTKVNYISYLIYINIHG
jgi:hypothetical protein